MPAPACTAEAAPTLTIRPSPAAIRWGVAALQAVAQVLTFMANILSHSARSPSCSVCHAKPPTKLIRATSRPVRALISAIAAEVASRSVRFTPASVQPFGPIRPAMRSGAPGATSSATTIAPALAASAATTEPRAPKPPVTTIVLPSICVSPAAGLGSPPAQTAEALRSGAPRRAPGPNARAGDQRPHRIGVGPPDRHAVAGGQADGQGAVDLALDPLDAVDIDHGRAVHPQEPLRIEPILQGVDRLADQVLAAVRVDAHIVPLGLEPLHRSQGQAHRPATAGHPHLGVVLRRRRLGLEARAAQGLAQRLALAAGALAIFDAPAARALARFDHLRELHGLEQIVAGRQTEGVDGVTVVGGDEDDRGAPAVQGLGHLQSAEAGKADVQEGDVGVHAPDQGQALVPVAGHADLTVL